MLTPFGMATTAHIPLSEYPETSYRPDREYVDGEIRERNVGRFEHARLQALLTEQFGKHETQWGVIGSIAQRVQVCRNRIRLPDLVILNAGPQPDVLTEPPLLIIEILSPDDTYSDTQERSWDYRNMGVETIWIIDPKTRSGRMCTGSNRTEAERLDVQGTPLYVYLPDKFSQVHSQNL